MLSALFNGTTIPVLEQVVNFAQARHEVLSGNIANMDTPGYRTKDLNTEVFQSQLRKAIDAGRRDSQGGGLAHGRISLGDHKFSSVRDSLKSILHHDDSNVSVEQQVTQLAKNQMQHNMAMSVLNNQFQLMESAISEKA
jgi:flagellar basal-body rod protein FlgB